MIESTGVPTMEMVREVFPSKDRINKGPVAVIECYQKIPCNPCSTVCVRKAIKEFDDINDRPIIDTDICNGCGMCISKCPGLAIMVVDGSYSEDKVIFRIPYEFLPLPNEGDIVKGLNRKGEYIGDVKVLKVQSPKSFDKTNVIHVAVDRKLLYEFRNIKVEPNEIKEEETIICRCSDVTLKEIRKLIKEGYTSVDEIKRITRAGMGPCQGRTCEQLILREISIMTGKNIAELKPATKRPPVKGIKLDAIAKAARGGESND